MGDLEKFQALRASGSNVVRVVVPLDVYSNLDKIQRITKDVLGKLGHAMCYSGWDVRFDFEKYFIVDEKLNVRAGGFGL